MCRLERERGAAVVEFALIVPLLLLLVFGIAEFGRAYYLQTTISNAAREGVRVMALTGDQTRARNAAIAAAATVPDTSQLGVTFSASTCAPDTQMTASVTYIPWTT